MKTRSQKQFDKSQNSLEVVGYILALRDRNLLTGGRNKKRDIQALIHREFGVEVIVNHSIEYDRKNRTLYEIGHGVKTGQHIDSGGFGTAKVARKILEFKPEMDGLYKIDPDFSVFEDGYYVAKVPVKYKNRKRISDKDKVFKKDAPEEAKIMQQLGYNAVFLRRTKYMAAPEAPGTLIMPMFNGTNLENYLNENDLTLEEKIDCAKAVMKAVGFLHQHGVLHLDIKPGNIIYDPVEKKAYLIDFGLSCEINHKNAFVRGGTTEYQSRNIAESWEGLPYKPTESDDIYAMGVTLAEIFSVPVKHALNDGFFSDEVSIGRNVRYRIRKSEFGAILNPMITSEKGTRVENIAQAIDLFEGDPLEVMKTIASRFLQEEKIRLTLKYKIDPNGYTPEQENALSSKQKIALQRIRDIDISVGKVKDLSGYEELIDMLKSVRKNMHHTSWFHAFFSTAAKTNSGKNITKLIERTEAWRAASDKIHKK